MPRPPAEHPTPGELEVLNILWERGPSTAREVWGVLNGRRERHYTSVNSLLNTMTDKGLLKRDQIRVIWTSPLIATPPVTIRKDLPLAMKHDLEKMFVRMITRDPKLAEAVAQGKTLGLRRVYHEDYVPIIKAKAFLKKQRKKKN